MKQLLQFLEELTASNTRDRMHAHQDTYKEAKTTALWLSKTLIEKISTFDSTLEDLTPEETLFRLAKDTRFSKDKSPYKTNFGIVIAPGGKKSLFPCYYVHLQPGNHSFIAGWLYHPEPHIQKFIRDALVTDRKTFQKLLSQKKFATTRWEIIGDSYKRVPVWFEATHPAVDLIKHKDWLFNMPLKDKELVSSDFVENITASFRLLHPVNAWLASAIREGM